MFEPQYSVGWLYMGVGLFVVIWGIARLSPQFDRGYIGFPAMVYAIAA